VTEAPAGPGTPAAGGDRPLDPTSLKRLHRGWRQRTSRRLALLLDGVQQPYNLGSIVRTAAAYGVERLWVAGPAAATPAAPGARKLSMGTERQVPWEHLDRAADAARAARDAGYRLVAVELTAAAVPLADVALGAATCLVLGHEDHGVSRACLEVVDTVAYLPTVGKVGSLNVAVAAAIAMAEARRQEWAAGPQA